MQCINTTLVLNKTVVHATVVHETVTPSARPLTHYSARLTSSSSFAELLLLPLMLSHLSGGLDHLCQVHAVFTNAIFIETL